MTWRDRAAHVARGPVAALLLGAATVLGFAPFYLHLVPPIALAGLVILLLSSASAHRSAWLGLSFGIALFGAGVSWIYVSLHDFGGMPMPLAIIAMVLLCTFLALFPSAVGWVQKMSRVSPAVAAIVLIPALWVIADWVRSWIFTGFPWLALGYSQVPYSPLSGFMPLLGVYGVSGLVAMSGGLLGLAVFARDWRWLLALAALWGVGYALQQVHWTSPAGAPLEVSLLQGNITQDRKFQEGELERTMALYRAMTLRSSSRLIIQPESSLPILRRQTPEGYLQELANHARRNSGDVLIGMFFEGAPEQYFNTMFSFGTAPEQQYRKHHLVPFGEFIPLRPLFGQLIEEILHIPMSDQSRGPARQEPLAVAGQQVAVNICYEDVFGEELIVQLPKATLLVNVSNDAWFGRSIGPQQHLQISQARALESGRYMLRATNTGVTAFIDERGHVLSRSEEFVTTALDGTAQGFSGATPYVRWGNAAALSLAFGSIAAALASGWRRQRWDAQRRYSD